MNTKLALTLAAAALALAPASALAQSSPAPESSPITAPAPQPTSPVMQSTAAPSTSAPAPTSMPATAPAPNPTSPPAVNGGGNAKNGNNGKHLGQVKKIQSGTLSTSDLRYAILHPTVEIGKLRKVKTVSFDKLRVYKLSAGLKSMLKVGDANDELPFLAELGPSFEVAQTNGSNSPIAMLQYVLANINVSNALNNANVLNGANVNVGVSLADVLNGNKISIGQVAGIFVNGLGVITTITK